MKNIIKIANTEHPLKSLVQSLVTRHPGKSAEDIKAMIEGNAKKLGLSSNQIPAAKAFVTMAMKKTGPYASAAVLEACASQEKVTLLVETTAPGKVMKKLMAFIQQGTARVTVQRNEPLVVLPKAA